MPSFDVVIAPDLVELRHAVEQAGKEIGTRFDFKGTSAAVALEQPGERGRSFMLTADSDFQLGQVRDVLLARLAKRGVDVRLLDLTQAPRRIGGDRMQHSIPVATGVDAATARRVQQAVKGTRLKVQTAVQGDLVRVSGAKRDELQAVIAVLRRELADVALGFSNFRD